MPPYVQFCRVINQTKKCNAQFRVAKKMPDGSFVGRDSDWHDVFPGKTYEFDLSKLILLSAIKSGDECMIQWQYDQDGFESQRNRPGVGNFIASTLDPLKKVWVAESKIVILSGTVDEPTMTPIEILSHEK